MLHLLRDCMQAHVLVKPTDVETAVLFAKFPCRKFKTRGGCVDIGNHIHLLAGIKCGIDEASNVPFLMLRHRAFHRNRLSDSCTRG